jgi:hypothetical protein
MAQGATTPILVPLNYESKPQTPILENMPTRQLGCKLQRFNSRRCSGVPVNPLDAAGNNPTSCQPPSPPALQCRL